MERSPEEVAYLRAVAGASTLAAELLAEMERVAEQLAPERSAALADAIESRFASALAETRGALAAAPAPEEFRPFDEIFAPAFDHAAQCAAYFGGFPSAPGPERIPRILAALHHHAQAQERFYVVRRLLPPFHTYWDLPDSGSLERPDGAAAAHKPLVRVAAGGPQGGFALYVPERYDQSRAWPLIVALHGGSGNGRDFLWTWVRDARSRGYLLVAPTAIGGTWSELDDQGLLAIVAWIRGRYNVAADRVLLTGLSDGGTFTLVYGLAHPDVFRALAPCCGVFHPVNLANGNIERARGVPIYLVHGVLDFLFPIDYARMTNSMLSDAGADLTYRELPDLSHTYPRSENPAILKWFEAKTGGPAS